MSSTTNVGASNNFVNYNFGIVPSLDDGLKNENNNLSSVFQAATAGSVSSSSSSMSAGATAMDIERAATERAAKVHQSLAGMEGIPTQEEVIKQLKESYFADEIGDYRKNLIKDAFEAFERSNVGQWNNISAFRFKEIMLASKWKELIKNPETFYKLFDLAVGNVDADRRKIDLVELAYVFIWLGNITDDWVDPEIAINGYHLIFFKREYDHTVKVLRQYYGIIPLQKIPKKEFVLRLGEGDARDISKYRQICKGNRNILLHNHTDAEYPIMNAFCVKQDLQDNNAKYIDTYKPYELHHRRRLAKSQYLKDLENMCKAPTPIAPPAPFPKSTL